MNEFVRIAIALLVCVVVGCHKSVSAELPDASDVPTVRRYLVDEARRGAPEAMFRLGVMYSTGDRVKQDYGKALQWYTLAAEQGHVDAQFNLATLHREGRGTQVDVEKAFYWTKQAAEAGDAEAQFNMGLAYAKGKGVERDDQKAVHWYRLSADGGYMWASTNLGFMYSQGRGVTKDLIQCAYWFRKAADAGEPGAQYRLGMIHVLGEMEPADWKDAYIQLRLADRWYVEETKEPLKELRAKLTKQEIEEAEEHIRLWNLAHPRRVAGAE